MCEIEPRFELIEIAHVGEGARIVGRRGRGRSCRAGGEPRNHERMREYREQSQNVDENKAHHFLEGYKSAVFGAPIGADQALKGARAIWEERCKAPGAARSRRTVDKMSARQNGGFPAKTFAHSSHKT